MDQISIITVNYNQPQVTGEFLKSIKQHGGSSPIELILVDNAPKESHADYFKSIFPELKYIYSTQNLGFAGGNNLGIQQASGTYLILLNNDTEITPDFFETMVSELELNPNLGLLSPLIKYFSDPEIIQYAGFSSMNYFTCRNKGLGHMEKDQGQYDTRYETGYCHGAAVICRREDLDRAGLMETHYFLYYEELDWCEKFKRIGKTIGFTGKTTIFHKESVTVGASSPLKTYFMTRNRMLFIRRNASPLQQGIFTFYYSLVACPAQMVKYMLKGRKDLARAVFKGLMWNFTHDKNSTQLGYPSL